MNLAVYPVTRERWDDLEKLFGTRGACGGCWCMWWRQSRSQFNQNKGEPNRKAMHRIVQAGELPGLLAYQDGKPIGWVCVAPREQFVRLANSRVLAPVDDQPVWSVVCFFIARAERRSGLSAALLDAAAEYAFDQGATIVEGYPVRAYSSKMPDAFAYTGLEEIFERAGFKVAIQRGKSRAIWRRRLGE